MQELLGQFIVSVCIALDFLVTKIGGATLPRACLTNNLAQPGPAKLNFLCLPKAADDDWKV